MPTDEYVEYLEAQVAKLTEERNALALVSFNVHAQVAALREVLLGFVNYPADDADYPPPYKKAREVLAATEEKK